MPGGGRRYLLRVPGRSGWSACYFKDVNEAETTLHFWQEIYDEAGQLAEVHEKYPVDKGRRKA